MDFSPCSNIQLSEKKYALIGKMGEDRLLNFSLLVDYHGIILEIKTSRNSVIDLIVKQIPSSWIMKEAPVTDFYLELYSIKDFKLENHEWENEDNPECFIQKDGTKEIAIQRDFAGVIEGNHLLAIINEEMVDGFFNVLRWFMPRILIKKQKAILHSSCVITHGQALFFLGHSGYGKSTMTTLAEHRIVLGDDMNILFKIKDSYFAQGAALGGLYNNREVLHQCYPVKAFYWLIKSDSNRVERMESSESLRKLISSYANIFWGDKNSEFESIVMNNAMEIIKRYPFYNLYFSLDKGFWKYVE